MPSGFGRGAAGAAFTLVLLSLSALPANAVAGGAPPRLSHDNSPPDISSTDGSGNFGQWFVDRYGLPAYRYNIDQQTAPQAAQPELAGNRDAWSQLGNDHIVANAYNHGYVQLWSEDRLYQWMNFYDPSHQHYAGGYGYLNVNGHVLSTLYDDRPAGASTERDFGAGYYEKHLAVSGLEQRDVVYAPFGNDSILLHDVTLTNSAAALETGSYFEYWDVNPEVQGVGDYPRGLQSPVYDAASKTLSVAQANDDLDTTPLTIFASALQTPVSGFETSTTAFFGGGSRAQPAAVSSGHLTGSIAGATPNGQVSQALLAIQSPFSLPPGQSVTLRYAYGFAHPERVGALVAAYRSQADALSGSEAQWSTWLPHTSFGKSFAWLSRELQWDAYMVRSGAAYDEGCGHHIISQGGYYQYYFGENEAYRDPLQHMLALIYSDPELAREVIRYSAHEQPAGAGTVPYGMLSLCRRFDLGTSDDLDQWLIWSTAEYVLATRDFNFLKETVPFSDAGQGAIWDHVKLAYSHQENVVGHGPHGEYVTGSTGDWNDFSTQFLQMTESDLVTAQAAYIYKRLALVADQSGDAAFAATLRSTAASDLDVVKSQLVSSGWFARGYSGARQIGTGEIIAEPQPWALLAGAATQAQTAQVVAAYHRFLAGVNAPAVVKGPALIGSAIAPASNDPDITEQSFPPVNNSGAWPGGAWFAVDGWWIWALGELDGAIPNARAYAWDELTRNTLTRHADVFPNHWDGIISVDDVCNAFFQTPPSNCGIGLTSAYNTQIMHQPAYQQFDILHLAGLTATAGGLQVVPHLPMQTFSVRFPLVGVAQAPGLIRGYLRAVQSGSITMSVALPPGVDANSAVAYVNGAVVPHSMVNGLVQFNMPAGAGTASDWAVSSATVTGATMLPNTAVVPKPLLLAALGLMSAAAIISRRRGRARWRTQKRMTS